MIKSKILLLSTMITLLFSSNELPIGFTEDEWNNRHLINEMGRETDPPVGPIRNIAEYEPMQGALIRYPFGISTAVIKEIAEDEEDTHL